MKPIGQTFLINEPVDGAPGVYLTSIKLWFKRVSTSFGVAMEIRETNNGDPTQVRLPFGFCHLDVDQVAASDDASVATTFKFDTPIYLESLKSYAFVIIPDGGNPDYQVWAGEIGETDVTTNSPIYTNNDTGTLFLSSNDIQWTSVQIEDIKFELYIAQYTVEEGYAAFTCLDEDRFAMDSVAGSFLGTEPLAVSNNVYRIGILNLANTVGSFLVGEKIQQANSTANLSFGTVYEANSTVIRYKKLTDRNFTNTYPIVGANSGATANIVSVAVGATTVSGNTTVSVPDSNLFGANQAIFFTNPSTKLTEIVRIANVVSRTQINVDRHITFSASDVSHGDIIGNGAIQSYVTKTAKNKKIILDNLTGANTTSNFSDASGAIAIGKFTKATGEITDVQNMPYHSIVPQFSTFIPTGTGLHWFFKGVENNPTYTQDVDYIAVEPEVENEFIDKERVIMSRSHELNLLPVGRKGDPSLIMKAHLLTNSTKLSPIVDTIRTLVTYTRNIAYPSTMLTGQYVTTTGVPIGDFSAGDQISSGNTSGTIMRTVKNRFVIGDISGSPFAVGGTIVNGANTHTITSVRNYSESIGNGPRNSRYISKNVVLDEKQDADDIHCFLTAYRPANTDHFVYARIQNSQDHTNFSTVFWSRLKCLTSDSMTSSKTNVNDYVELEYTFPSSVISFTTGTACNTTSNNVTMASTYGISAGDFIYLSDAPNNKYTVRQVSAVPNNSVLTLTQVPSFTMSNGTIGTIPDLESQYGAFKNMDNNGVVRYVRNDDVFFDTFKMFAMKIVPVADVPYIVPRCPDLRVIALQV